MPDWLDADRLAQLSLVVMFALAVGGVIVAKIVKAIVTKLLYMGIIAIAIFAIWTQRDELRDCQATCSCSLFGRDVAVPDNPACGDDAVSLHPASLLDLVLDR